MPFWIFKKRDEPTQDIQQIQHSLKSSFSHIKKDISDISSWVENIEQQHKHHKESLKYTHSRMDEIHERINELENAFEDIANQWEAVQTAVQNKQTPTAVRSKQVFQPVQTAVQTDEITKHLTPMERAIISILLNTDMKLTYDDLSIAIGRDKSTIRGQMNNIKQKNEELIKEVIESNGKKRFYIEEEIKNKVFKQRNRVKILQENKRSKDKSSDN